ncbi:hypothetical protein [Maridesulfovibrio sp.]|uniref:hypothetical protein n=1 Tax=Maridesulfovibrio sp. TaxID=2795000 RepID=UPI0039F04864
MMLNLEKGATSPFIYKFVVHTFQIQQMSRPKTAYFPTLTTINITASFYNFKKNTEYKAVTNRREILARKMLIKNQDGQKEQTKQNKNTGESHYN